MNNLRNGFKSYISALEKDEIESSGLNTNHAGKEMPRQYSIVSSTPECRALLNDSGYGDSPLAKGRQFICLGEIPNQQGHAVIIDCTAKETIIGVHIEDLIELSQDEL